MKILTFDIEEWYIAKSEGYLTPALRSVYDAHLDKVLQILDDNKIGATFFCVGKMATDFPEVIHKINDSGHEIGCHSNVHTWLNKMSENECRKDTKEAIDSLQQCIGEKIISYRAPAFSIGESNKWAFDILVENGIENDSSVFPASRDFGGFPQFGNDTPVLLEHNGVRIKEFPIPMTTFLGMKVAYSGGGYLRLFPLLFIQRKIKSHPYSLIYLHIEDLLSENCKLMTKSEYEEYFKEPGTIYARYKRYLKANLGRKGTWVKLESLLANMHFNGISRSSTTIDWEANGVMKI